MSISRNATYNILGALVPTVMIIVTVPLYLQIVGLERYGVITLCMAIIGYASLADNGISSALIRKMAETRDDVEEASALFWTSIYLALAIGAAGGLLMYFGASWYFSSLADQSPHLRGEFAATALVLTAMVPMAMVAGVMTGALVARERFLFLNIAATIGQALAALLPLAVAYLWTSHLAILIAALLCGRVIILPWVAWTCRRAVPIRKPVRADRSRLSALAGFTGWMSLTLVLTGIIQTLDRMVIGARLGAAVVPLYAIPYGVVARLILIAESLANALFPRLASVSQEEQKRLTASAFKAVAAIVTPITIGLVAITAPFFQIWMGPELAATSVPIAYVLAGGFWLTGFGRLAYTILQAVGRPALVTRIFLVELVLYALLLTAGLSAFGLMGAALAFTVRALLDLLAFLWFNRPLTRGLWWMFLPASLVAGSILAALLLPFPAFYMVVLPLLGGACLWSLLNIPPSLERFVPFRRYLKLFGKNEVLP